MIYQDSNGEFKYRKFKFKLKINIKIMICKIIMPKSLCSIIL